MEHDVNRLGVDFEQLFYLIEYFLQICMLTTCQSLYCESNDAAACTCSIIYSFSDRDSGHPALFGFFLGLFQVLYY